MSLGLEGAGFTILYANELNKDAAKTYRHNFPSVKLQRRSIRSVTAKSVHRMLGPIKLDVIAAGPPCQGFSTAGRRKPRDPRNLLYKEVLRFAKELRPRVIVIENVLGMLQAGRGKFIARVEEELDGIGYKAQHKVLTASSFGVPQRRKRLFIIATEKAVRSEDLFPRPFRRRVSVSEALSDLKFLGPGQAAFLYAGHARSAYQKIMRASSGELTNHQAPNHSARVMEFFSLIPKGRNARKVPGLPKTGKRDRYKLNPRRQSNTLTTLPEDFVHYSQNRILTVREMARLQSFPDRFEFMGPRTTGGPARRISCPQYTQVGNAVPPLLAEAVFSNLASWLRRDGGQAQPLT
jgi:DNA (cytosine-5)-methyltransferase 1